MGREFVCDDDLVVGLMLSYRVRTYGERHQGSRQVFWQTTHILVDVSMGKSMYTVLLFMLMFIVQSGARLVLGKEVRAKLAGR